MNGLLKRRKFSAVQLFTFGTQLAQLNAQPIRMQNLRDTGNQPSALVRRMGDQTRQRRNPPTSAGIFHLVEKPNLVLAGCLISKRFSFTVNVLTMSS